MNAWLVYSEGVPPPPSPAALSPSTYISNQREGSRFSLTLLSPLAQVLMASRPSGAAVNGDLPFDTFDLSQDTFAAHPVDCSGGGKVTVRRCVRVKSTVGANGSRAAGRSSRLATRKRTAHMIHHDHLLADCHQPSLGSAPTTAAASVATLSMGQAMDGAPTPGTGYGGQSDIGGPSSALSHQRYPSKTEGRPFETVPPTGDGEAASRVDGDPGGGGSLLLPPPSEQFSEERLLEILRCWEAATHGQQAAGLCSCGAGLACDAGAGPHGEQLP